MARSSFGAVCNLGKSWQRILSAAQMHFVQNAGETDTADGRQLYPFHPLCLLPNLLPMLKGFEFVGSCKCSAIDNSFLPVDGIFRNGFYNRKSDTKNNRNIMAVEDLRKSGMMRHLMEALEAGEDIGHYGRLTFAMIARHFISQEELVEFLTKDPDCSESEAKALYQQVQGKDYNPPKRDRILEWQQQQDFPICPNPDDPDACNIYRDLEFPSHVYEHISSYYEHKA